MNKNKKSNSNEKSVIYGQQVKKKNGVERIDSQIFIVFFLCEFDIWLMLVIMPYYWAIL